MALHSNREGLHATQDQVTVERARDCPSRVLNEPEALGKLRIPHRDEAADHVAVTSKVLGGRVHDDVGTEREGLLEIGGGKGVVNDHERIAVVCEPRCLGDVDDVQQRIGRALDPKEPRLGAPGVIERFGVRLVGRCVAEARGGMYLRSTRR